MHRVIELPKGVPPVPLLNYAILSLDVSDKGAYSGSAGTESGARRPGICPVPSVQFDPVFGGASYSRRKNSPLVGWRARKGNLKSQELKKERTQWQFGVHPLNGRER